MPYIKIVDHPHYCKPPEDALRRNGDGAYIGAGSLWRCDYCQSVFKLEYYEGYGWHWTKVKPEEVAVQ